MQNKKLIILAVLGIIAILSLFYGIFAPTKTKPPAQVSEPGIQLERKAILIEKPILTQRVAKRTKYSSWGEKPVYTPENFIQGV